MFFLEIKCQNGAHLKKGLFLTNCSHFLINREKTQKFLQHTSHLHRPTYKYFPHPFDFFCLTKFAKNTNLSCVVSLWCDSWCWSLFAPFWSNQQITKWWAKFKLECLLLIFINTSAKFVVIFKPWNLNAKRTTSKQQPFCFLKLS